MTRSSATASAGLPHWRHDDAPHGAGAERASERHLIVTGGPPPEDCTVFFRRLLVRHQALVAPRSIKPSVLIPPLKKYSKPQMCIWSIGRRGCAHENNSDCIGRNFGPDGILPCGLQ